MLVQPLLQVFDVLVQQENVVVALRQVGSEPLESGVARRFFHVGLFLLFLCVFHFCPGLALADGVVPSVDKCGIRLVRLFLHGFLQNLQCLQGCGDVFSAFFYGTDKGKPFLVEADFCFQSFLVRFQLCLIVE